MSAYVALSQTRYAVRRTIALVDADGVELCGLLIEVFSEGCRISNVATAGLENGRPVSLRVDGIEDIAGHVHWACDGIVRLRFARPLAAARLRGLIGSTRRRPSTFEPTFFFAASAGSN